MTERSVGRTTHMCIEMIESQDRTSVGERMVI